MTLYKCLQFRLDRRETVQNCLPNQLHVFNCKYALTQWLIGWQEQRPACKPTTVTWSPWIPRPGPAIIQMTARCGPNTLEQLGTIVLGYSGNSSLWSTLIGHRTITTTQNYIQANISFFWTLKRKKKRTAGKQSLWKLLVCPYKRMSRNETCRDLF